VTQHGGSVSVERNPDKGSTFTLFFPQAKGSER
jgi:signal transduction histidine kinase